MKRGRTEEIQFGQPPPRVGGTAPHQRMITTTIQPHNAGPTIQYQIASSAASPVSVVGGGKTTTTTPADVAANLSQQQVVQSSQQVPQQSLAPSQPSSVQYTTTSYTTGIAGTNLVKTTGHAQPSAPQPAQQIHVVNTTSGQVRGGKVTPSTGVPQGTVGAGGGGGASVVGGGGQVITTLATNVISNAQPQPPPPPPQGQAQFQRLKVEDALSYLDQVKFRFGNQPQVYNDFLDIMKEFKSQSIDTPGVIQRVSNLFKGHPELIVGFNTFLPPGYKIEVQANDQGYAFQVSVSVPSTSAGTAVAPQPSPHKYSTIFQGGGQIVQTGNSAVNLMTYGHSTGSVHTTTIQPVGPSGPGSNSNATSISTIPQSPQNFSRDRERTISGGSGGPTLPANSVGGGTTTVNAVAPDSSVIASQQNLHRMISQQVIPHPPPQQQQQPQQAPPQQQQPPTAEPQGGGATPNQPVEFNHAITYVNKIKNRFHSQPEKYKRFLEILHTYQKEQKIYKEGPQGGCNAGAKQLTEAEVYTQVAKLFDNQEDLLREFGQFLPDATSHAPSSLHAGGANKNHTLHEQSSQPPVPPQPHSKKMSGSVMNASGVKAFNSSHAANLSRLQERDYGQSEKDFASGGPGAGGGRGSNAGIEKEPRNHVSNQKYAHNAAAMQGSGLGGGNATKRSPSYQSAAPMGGHGMPPREREGPPTKRYKPTCRDITIAEASKFGTLNDYAFFDKVRKALRSPDVYENFLRCLTLFNQEIVSKSELQTLVTPFLSRFPDLLKWFQDFLGPPTATTECVPLASAQRQDRSQSEIATDIDLSTCKRLGASYCALPKSHENVKCSGRTSLCKDVLNDTWVSFPTWAEDSTFVTSRKTQYEEFIYRCEDERFELDVVIETNSATIRVLEGVQKKLSRMSPDEVSRFRLDECLGGTSPTIHQRALRRIYGDKAADIIQGLKKNPVVAVPVVLRRLKTKEEEWREAQKGFNKQWREQNEKYYLKSLDHQGINFKQNDIKSLRSKSLFNEIETLLDEVSYMKRHEQHEDGVTNPLISGPHLVLPYKDKTILDDAANLLIHHVKRQTGIQKQEKARIKHILRQFVPDLFFAPRQQLSDDEREEAEDKDMDVDGDNEEENRSSKNGNKNNGSNGSSTSSSSAASSSAGQDGKEAAATSSSTAIKEETEGAAKTTATTTTSTTEGTPAADAAKRSSTEESGKDSASEAAAIKTEIKQENDPDQPASSTSATTPAAGSSQPANPALPAHAISKHLEEAYTLFFTNNNWYLFLRLHAILCERLRTIYERAQIIATEEKAYQSTRTNSTATALRLKPKSEIKVEEFYATFLDMLKNVLDGNMEAGNYEDSLREMFGIHAYIAFTLDRVVQNAVRQLQHCVTERGALECVELFQLEQRKGGAGGLCRTANRRVNNELAYQRKAEAALQDENCFKVYIYKIDCRVTIELLETDTEDTAQNFASAQQFSNYVDRLSNPAATGTGSESGASTAGGGGGTVTGSTTTTAGPNAAANATNVEIKTEKPDEETPTTGGPRKALFLQRNMRRCKTGCPSPSPPPPPEKTTSAAATTTTTATTTAKTAVKKEPSVTPAEKSKTAKVADASPPVVNNNNIGGSKKDVDGGVTTVPHPPPPVVWNSTGKVKTPPERLPSSNGDQNYFVDDREQFRLNVNNYKICYVLNKDHIFYKRKSLLRAKETHPKVTQEMHARFEGVVQRWLERHVTDAQRADCKDWLMGVNSDLPKGLATVVKRNNDVARTPYMTYSRYRVEKVPADHHLS
uniref:Paired amphipathic helix protein Sin3a n=1 Tax=Culex pipiens TaxID=7175 RepID=A0A8D8FNN4_CULPI